MNENVPSPSIESVVVSALAARYRLDASLVARALALLDEGWAIPYLARYRREDVGGLDEDALWNLRLEAHEGIELERRRAFILQAVAERDVAEKVKRRIQRCRTRTELEYVYEPYRPPRKTPGTLAKERGLEPLAEAWLKGEVPDAAASVDPSKGVASPEEALLGAREILAERFAVDPDVRGAMLRAVEKEGVLRAAPPPGQDEIPGRYASMRTYEERLARVPSHRYLALRRAEKEGAVSVRVEFPDTKVLAMIAQRFYPKEPAEEVKAFLDLAAADAVRLMRPAVFEDALHHAKDRADAEAIGVFCKNLRDLLLYPPAGPHRVLGVDPAPRGQIPVACVDEKGQPLEHDRLKFFDKDPARVAAARERLQHFVRTHTPQLVALGNGAGRRECEAFLRSCFEELGELAPAILVVNETGVGSYAGGPVGRAELPVLPVPVRAAISLARRLMDPLPELVKVDPKQIGVGQYQNDVDPQRLRRALDEVVEHCVNSVGVDLNRAPVQQLARVSGLSSSLARALVEQRDKHGPFRSLQQLKDLPFMPERAFEQAGGFLRIHGGEDPLDATGLHPSHAPLAQRIAGRCGVEPGALIGNTELLASLDVEAFAGDGYGPVAVASAVAELLDGGEDPRPRLDVSRREPEVRSASELKPGMQLAGRVTNVTNFGAFVDVGVQQDGLVHVSELANHFVKDPTTVVRVGEVVNVRVLGVDADSGRISLSMKSERGGRGGSRGDRDRGGRGERTGRGGRGERGERGGPRRGRPRRERRPDDDRPARDEEPAPREDQPVEVTPAAPELPENPVPADMTEEEFMRLKMEELRRRFS